MLEEYLFVYGTLKSTIHKPVHAIMDRCCDYLGQGTFQGKLYLIDHYPGAVESSDTQDQVHGEIYLIHQHQSLFEALDNYEECSADYPEPHEYQRCQVQVTLEGGKRLNAWIYLYRYPLTDKPLIGKGVFELTS